MGRFSGKVAIVTGSSNGIGRATAIHFARDGAKVTITGRDAKALEINNHGGAFKECDDAGNLMIDPFDKVMELNCKSTLAMTLKALQHLQSTKGCIVNVSSIASKVAAAPHPYYAASKAALDHLTKTFALQQAQNGIRVNAVNPGFIKTEFMKKLGCSDEYIEKFLEKMTAEAIPVGRYGVPDDIAEMITFLSDEKTAGFITGQTIVVDGGTTLLQVGFSRERTLELGKH